MVSNFKYSLEKGSKKFHCPRCEEKTFVRYKDNYRNEYLPKRYGQCDRSEKCQYSLSPYKDGYIDGINKEPVTQYFKNKIFATVTKPIYFDKATYNKYLQTEDLTKNTFIGNLVKKASSKYSPGEVYDVAKLYQLGTIGEGDMTNAITFPFIDSENNIRAVQVKHFNKDNRTVRTNFLHTLLRRNFERSTLSCPDWLKSYFKNEKIITCLFGEHLLRMYPNNPVALVEAPKTAIYGSLFFGLPKSKEDLIWLAVYSKDTFTLDKLKALKNRKVIVFPDLSYNGSTFKEWKKKAELFTCRIPGVQFIFSDLLEIGASEEDRKQGLDLADFLVRDNWHPGKDR